jgi:hypothetical protein
LNILFDGWADLDRMTEELSVLEEIKPYGLSIIESRYKIFRRRIDVLPDYKDYILGCVSEQSRILALKYAKSYVTFGQTISTDTTQQWMSLEATASRLPVVHHGNICEKDVREGVVIERPEQEAFLGELARFQEDGLYQEKSAHLGWRKTYQSHTFAHRMRTICKTIGIEHDWIEYPKASLITPTYRRDMLPRCLQTFERQTYPNKELILVFNGNEVPSHGELGLENPRSDVKLANVPNDLFTGACMNVAHLMASGEFIFKLDDDDHYGNNYLADCMLYLKVLEIDLFGKPISCYYVFERTKRYTVMQLATSQMHCIQQTIISLEFGFRKYNIWRREIYESDIIPDGLLFCK